MRTQLPTLTSLKSVPGSVPGKERLCRSLRVPRKERQSRSCHGTGKIKNYFFFSQEGGGYFRMVPTLVSAHVRKLWVPLPLIHFDSTFVLGIVRTLVCTGYDFDIAYEICQYV